MEHHLPSQTPSVSFIMGVYNAAKFLKRSLDSIIWQSYSDWELVICDDASTDNTVDIIKSYNDPRIKLLQNSKNQGLGLALNRCLEAAQGRYLVRQDADDYSFFDRIRIQIEFMEQHPEYDIVGCSALLFDENEDIWGMLAIGNDFNLNNWLREAQIIHPTAMIRKETMNIVKGYNPRALRVEDYELWIRMIKIGTKFYNLEKPLYYYQLTKEDYKKKKIINRLRETKYRYLSYKKLGFPLKSYLYLAKTLFMIIVPKILLYRYHHAKFRQSYRSYLLSRVHAFH